MKPSGVQYKLNGAIRVVKLQDRPGSSIRYATHTLVEIPPDQVVELEGAAAPSGLVNIFWQGHPYSAYFEDLAESAVLFSNPQSTDQPDGKPSE